MEYDFQCAVIPPFCRFDSAKVLTDTVSVSTRGGNVTDILSATLRTISPFALVCVILPLARTRTSKCRSDWWRAKCPAPAEGGSRLQNANLVLGTSWRTFFPRRCQKSGVHFAFLIFKGAFYAFEPSQQRGMQNAPHGKRVRASI